MTIITAVIIALGFSVATNMQTNKDKNEKLVKEKTIYQVRNENIQKTTTKHP